MAQAIHPDQPKTTAKAAAPKPKPGKLSQQHKSPPRKIRKPIFDDIEEQIHSEALYEDDDGKHIYLTRGCLLGEGGFARVYAMKDEATNKMGALKVVNKDQLKSSKNKSKLYAEIKLHRAMDHPHIVKFHSCFEDSQNVYLQMELCEHGSLLDLLRLRKRYSEPEARLLLYQLISACAYMHDSSVIHRDLKPGNLFFATESSSLYGQDGNDGSDAERGLCVKVGDFGLAALVKFKGDRRKTICGTPNYIAPEILFDQTNGHSFEVDIWSVGVILYALLIGKPPFQTKDVNQIYRNIKANAYSFPTPSLISPSATDLISLILNQKPEERPSLGAIVLHPWFSDGPFPFMIPMSALDICPDFSKLSKFQSDRFRSDYIRKLGLDAALQEESISMANLSRNQRTLGTVGGAGEADDNRHLNEIVEEEEDEGVRAVSKKMSKIALKSEPQEVLSKGKRALAASANSERPPQKRVVSAGSVGVTLTDPIKASKERRRVEREAQSAVNPGSPISELLKSARKPLYVSPHGNMQQPLMPMKGQGVNQLFQKMVEEKENKRAAKEAERAISNADTGSDVGGENERDERNGLGQSTRAERKAKRQVVPQRIKDENDPGKQKARIASGMLDYGSGWSAAQRNPYLDDGEDAEEFEPVEDDEKPPKSSTQRSKSVAKVSSEKPPDSAKSTAGQLVGRLAQKAPATTSSTSEQNLGRSGMTRKPKLTASQNPTLALYDACHQTLMAALGATTPEALMKLPFYDGPPEEDPQDQPQTPGVFIQSWVDYTHKYGTAYAMTDGSSGLYFNDGTTMVMAADRNHFDYIFNRTGMVYQRKNYTLKPKNYPIELERKTYLLEYFEDYMFTTLKRNVKWAYRDLNRTKHLDFVVKYYRMNNAIVFKMSNDLIQINFWDHQKLLLTDNARKITLIEPDLNLKTYYIGELFKEAYELGLFKPSTDNQNKNKNNKKKRTTNNRGDGQPHDDGDEDEEEQEEFDRELEDDEDDVGKDPEWIAQKKKVAFVLSKLEYARSVLKSLVDRGSKEKEPKKSNKSVAS
ncbi:Cell cycle serine/threonine-protein kinase cdc5/MSD2 [Puccinia graminis f. sp. tritici]|uniref:Cell cycle serine/threonine-protein kinase cdc5/MSD2 n=1 Tax=Puccinia graminis f. sp. tritici TaxID=56615 RepID=A0A5B0SM88_PUCGR|nr:Cell cycle serine/threonine-protein kinase cdc5/MSD2 [Puccinia graminis f. sp. tritici]